MAVKIRKGTGVFDGMWVVEDCKWRRSVHYTEQDAARAARHYRGLNAAATRKSNREVAVEQR